MREATFSLTRVAVLMLLTGSFAVVWSNDQRAQSAFALARKENWRPASAAPVEVAASTTSSRTRSKQLHHFLSGFARAEMQLPAGITPGRYLIVEPTGRMSDRIITIDSDRARSSDRDLYSVEITGQGRRYFIHVPEDRGDQPSRNAAIEKLSTRR